MSLKSKKGRYALYVRKDLSKVKKSQLRIPEIKLLTINRMKSLGVYNEAYEDLIDIYANMIFEYETCRIEFDETGAQYEVETAAGGSKKSGLVSAMEVLRKDIGTYSDRLKLNPKSIDITPQEPEDKMTKFLRELENG